MERSTVQSCLAAPVSLGQLIAVQNEVMFAATVERGQQNMAQLEQAVIKDNTLMPGECTGDNCIWPHLPIKAAIKRLTRLL